MTHKFDTDGLEKLDIFSIQQAEALKAIASKIKEIRKLDSTLFSQKGEYMMNPQHKDVNPKKGRNLTERFSSELKLVENSFEPRIKEVLGDYYIQDKKFVVGVPKELVPDWVKDINEETKVANLGAYVEPYYRDMTYFYGIDLHQDAIDWPNQNTDMITLYVYLEDVDELSSPLHVVPKSYDQGVDTFPHDITPLSDGRCIYNKKEYNIIKLTGRAGSTYFWHSCTLHGTAPTKSSKPRVSLRYLIRKQETDLDRLNTNMKGPQIPSQTRRDLDKEGKAVLKSKQMKDIDN